MRSIYLALAFLVFSAPAFSASELVMFNASYYEWCELWEQDVGVVYEKTWESRIVPIRRVVIHGTRPNDLKPIKAVIYTPTFVLIDNGREVGRITGYPGEGHFWALLDEMIKQLPVPLHGCDTKKNVVLIGTNTGAEPKTC